MHIFRTVHFGNQKATVWVAGSNVAKPQFQSARSDLRSSGSLIVIPGERLVKSREEQGPYGTGSVNLPDRLHSIYCHKACGKDIKFLSPLATDSRVKCSTLRSSKLGSHCVSIVINVA